jgi:hypothetical protein
MAAVRNGNWREAGGRGFRSAPYLLNIKRKGLRFTNRVLPVEHPVSAEGN